MNAKLGHQLRFGIMCDGRTLAHWQARSVQRLLQLDEVKLALVIVDPSYRRRLWKIRFGDLLFQSYRHFLAKSRATEPEVATDLLSEAPRLTCKTIKRGSSEYLRDEDIEAVHKYDLDFILKFSYGFLKGKVLDVARYGIWSFRHGVEAKYRGIPACFWEIYYGLPVTRAVLQRISEQPDTGVVLRKGFFRAQNSSYARNLELLFSESSRWPSQVCLDILNNCAEYLSLPPGIEQPLITERLRNRETVLFLMKILLIRLKVYYRQLFRYSFWNIGVVEARIDRFLDPNYKPKIDWLPRPPKGEFKADPFGMLNPPNIQVFFENLDYHHPKGIIYTAQVNNGNFASPPEKMIELPVHMSYPFIVEYDSEVYCVPETNRAREISVYKAVALPHEWRKEGILLTDVMAIDTTIFRHEGTWWMTFTDRERGGDANLYVWYAPDFWGPWKPHLNNPVKSDVRSARPGGTPFYHDGFLYRPAQDCSRTGGGQIILNRIRRLTPTEFDEKPVVAVRPDRNGPYPEGLHTLSQVQDFTLVDGKRFAFSAVGFVNNVIKGVKRTLDHD